MSDASFHSGCAVAPTLLERVRELRRITGGSRNCGWMCDEQAFMLYAITKWFKPEVVVQTGHLWGKSALVAAEALDDGFLTGETSIEDQPQQAHEAFSLFVAGNTPAMKRGSVISIDPLPRNVPHWQEGVEFIRTHHPTFTFHQMTSDEYFRNVRHGQLPSPKGKRLMGIVDGDHSYLGCMRDLHNFHALGAALIIVDDTSWIPFIRRACTRFAARHGYSFCHLPDYNGLGMLTRQNVHGSAPRAPTTILSHVSEWSDALGGRYAAETGHFVSSRVGSAVRRAWRLGRGAIRRLRRPSP